eukprot:COSAG01_NODE_73136_length_251_cov_0.657895_1_plen_56_part_01
MEDSTGHNLTGPEWTQVGCECKVRYLNLSQQAESTSPPLSLRTGNNSMAPRYEGKI